MSGSPIVSPSIPGLRGGPQDSILWVKELVKEFELKRPGIWQQERQSLRAVDGVSFDIRRSETFGLVGESGCGKSTTARCILRLLQPTRGEIYFDGTDLINLSKDEMRRVRRRMQIVFQDPYASLDPRMSVREIVEEPLLVHRMRDRAERLEKAQEMLSLVGITAEESDRRPHAFFLASQIHLISISPSSCSLGTLFIILHSLENSPVLGFLESKYIAAFPTCLSILSLRLRGSGFTRSSFTKKSITKPNLWINA